MGSNSWGTEISEMRTKYIPDIRKVDPELADIGSLILMSITEAAFFANNGTGDQIKTSHIIRDLSEHHNAWLHRITLIQGSGIKTEIQKMNNLLDRFYDTFILPKPSRNSML